MRSRRATARGQTLIVFALAFALFLFALVCVVADTAFLFRWSGAVQAAAQLAAQSGADAVDPRYLYGASQGCTAQPASRCGAAIIDVSAEDRRGSLYAFQRACIQAGDQTARVPRDASGGSTLKTAEDPQTPDGTACDSDGCRVYAVVTRAVALPIPLPGFPSTAQVRGRFYAAPVIGGTTAETVCTGRGWVPSPP